MSNARENRMTAPTRDTHANWTTNNPVLPEGVLGIVKDRRYSGSVEYIVGDGVTAYSALKKFGDVHRADGKIDPNELCIVGACTDGAIFESGSNANGHWIKYANGTMECYGITGTTLTLAAYGSLYDGAVSISYPARYVDDNVVNIASVQFSMQSVWCSCTSKSSSQLTVRVIDIAARSGTFLFQWRSIGRWK